MKLLQSLPGYCQLPGFLLLAVLICTRGFAHPIHVSVCQAVYSSAGQDLSVTVTIFTDDLELAIYRDSEQKLFLGLPGQVKDARQQVLAYVDNHLAFMIDRLSLSGQPRDINIRISEVRTTISIKLDDIPHGKQLIVTNTLLTGIYDDQKNLVRAKIDGRRESKALNNSETRTAFSL